MYLAIRALIDPRIEELELDPYPVNHHQRRIADRVQDRAAAPPDRTSSSRPALPMRRGTLLASMPAPYASLRT
jgi:hypothetical protein